MLAKLAVSIQDLVDRTSGRKAPIRMPSLHDLSQLGRSPAVLLSEHQDFSLDLFGRSVRMAIGSPGAVFDRLQALGLDPVDLRCLEFDGGRTLDFAAIIVSGGRDGTKRLPGGVSPTCSGSG